MADFPIPNREIPPDRPARRTGAATKSRKRGRTSRRFRFGVSVTATAFFPRGGIHSRRRFWPDMGAGSLTLDGGERSHFKCGLFVDGVCKSRSDSAGRPDFKSGLCQSGVDSAHSNGGGSFPRPFCKCPNVWTFAALAHCPHFKCGLSAAGQIRARAFLPCGKGRVKVGHGRLDAGRRMMYTRENKRKAAEE